MLPDADTAGWGLGIAYSSAFGHRGATHSAVFAWAMALIAAASSRWLRTSSWRAFGFVDLASLSPPLLDTLTNGGLGVALAWPFDVERFFFPWRPIEVSPVGAGFFSARGLAVIGSEWRRVVLPTAILAAALLTGWRRCDARREMPQRHMS